MKKSISSKSRRVSFVLVLISALLITGCGAVDISRYENNQPKLDLVSYFSGNTRGWGIVQDRSGKLLRQFVVDIQGTVDENNILTLDEDFTWSDGETSRRVWKITPEGEFSYVGTAEDVVGEATGKLSGNALNWNYVLTVKSKDSSWDIRFDDWMFLQPDGVLINRARMSKFGFRVGEVIIAFQKNSGTRSE